MAIVGTKSVNITDKNGETINLPAMHAYGIKEFTEEYITLINPWNSSKEVCIPKEEFFKKMMKIFKNIKASDMPNFDNINKDADFKEKLRDFKIKTIEKNLIHLK